MGALPPGVTEKMLDDAAGIEFRPIVGYVCVHCERATRDCSCDADAEALERYKARLDAAEEILQCDLCRGSGCRHCHMTGSKPATVAQFAAATIINAAQAMLDDLKKLERELMGRAPDEEHLAALQDTAIEDTRRAIMRLRAFGCRRDELKHDDPLKGGTR